MPAPTFSPDHPVAPFGTALINETVPSGGGLSVDNTVQFLGAPSTKINIPINLGSPAFEVGTSTASFNPGPEAEQAFARTKVFAVKTDGANTITGARLSVGNDTLTVGYQFNRRNLYTDTHDGWTIFVREPGADAVGGSPDLSGNVRTRLALTASGNIVAGDVWIGFAGVLEAQPTTVVLTFDDGYAEWTWLAGELASRGLPASFGIAYGDVDKAGYLTASEVQAIGNHASGLFEITNHAEGNDSLADLGLSTYIGEVEACRTYIEGLGLPSYPARLHAWVQGVFSVDAVDDLKGLGYHSARAVEVPGQVANHVSIALGGAQSNALYAIPATAYLNSSHTVAQVKAQIELAAPGGTVFVVGHRFGDTANSATWIDGYDTDHGILDLLDWLEDKRDNDGWTIQNWSTWHKEITGAAVEGSLVATLGAVTLVATGEAPSSGSLNASLSALTLVATGESQSAPVVGALDATLGSLAITATGTVRVAGSLATTLGALTLAATGEAATPATEGTLDITLGALALTSTGEASVAGSLTATLGAIGLSAAGESPIAGAAGITLGALALQAAGESPVTGAASIALGALTLQAAGESTIAGVASVALGALTLEAAGESTVAGALSVTLGALSLYSVDGTPALSGAVNATLGDLVLVATGQAPVTGSAALTLGALTLHATAGSEPTEIHGQVAATLGDLTLVAAGESQQLPGEFGALSVTLGALTMTASGSAPITGSATITLGDLVLVAGDITISTGPHRATVRAATRGARITRIT